MATTWALIGSGNIGSTIARLALVAGHEVILSNSRGPETLSDLVDELGAGARAATIDEAARAGDVVVVTIPLKAYPEVPVEPLRGKIVIDTMNYYPDRDGRVEALDEESTTTSQMLQEHLPEASVVKAFNNIYFEHLRALARPGGSADRSALPIAGNDDAAKSLVTRLFDEIGYDTLDLGPLAEGWRTQRDTAAYAVPYLKDPQDWSAGPSPADADTIADRAASAQRYRDR